MPSTVSAMGKTAILLACRYCVSRRYSNLRRHYTYIFDIWARQDRDHVTVLNTQVVAHNTVDSGTAFIQLLVGKDNEHGILSLLASYKDCVATEKLKGVHGSLGQGDDAVVIINGIGNPAGEQLAGWLSDVGIGRRSSPGR